MKIALVFIFCVQIIVFSKETIAVKSVRSDFLSSTEKESVTNFITSSLADVAIEEIVMAWSDLEEIIKQLGETSELASLAANDSVTNCISDKCFQELGGVLGVEKILITDVSKVGTRFVINMRIINLLEASSKARGSLRVQNGMDGILDGVPHLLVKLGYKAPKESNRPVKSLNYTLPLESDDAPVQAELLKNLLNKEKERVLAEKQEAASLAAHEAKEVVLDKADPYRKVRAWTRYSSLGLALVGGAATYVGNQLVEESYDEQTIAAKNFDSNGYASAAKKSQDSALLRSVGIGVLSLGVVGFAISFTL